MPRYAVNSSILSSVEYHAAQSALEVEFRDGSRYRFLDVPANCLPRLLASDSKGGYFNQHVRNRFRFQRISGSRLRRVPEN
jgi:hypothetical protein